MIIQVTITLYKCKVVSYSFTCKLDFWTTVFPAPSTLVLLILSPCRAHKLGTSYCYCLIPSPHSTAIVTSSTDRMLFILQVTTAVVEDWEQGYYCCWWDCNLKYTFWLWCSDSCELPFPLDSYKHYHNSISLLWTNKLNLFESISCCLHWLSINSFESKFLAHWKVHIHINLSTTKLEQYQQDRNTLWGIATNTKQRWRYKSQQR